MSFSYTWHGRELAQRLRAACRAATLGTAELAVSLLKDRVDTPFPPTSVPGESPHRRTGHGQASIHAEVDADDLAHVTVDERYMLDLEVGTAKIAPRPWFRVTISENAALLRRHHAELFRHRMNV